MGSKKNTLVSAVSTGALALGMWSCSMYETDHVEKDRRYSHLSQSGSYNGPGATINQDNIESIDLSKTPYETPLETLVINLRPNGLNLHDSDSDQISWSVDLEEWVEIEGVVGAQKYLRVSNQLILAENFENRSYDIGCLFVELKDNVTYDKQGWLRMASTGIYGDVFTQIEVPLEVQRETWKVLEKLPDSSSLARFKENSIKSFKGQFCFRMDFSEAPAQTYRGQIVVQYLIADKPSEAYIADIPPAAEDFKCSEETVVLRAGQSKDFQWNGTSATYPLLVNLNSDSSAAYDLGSYNWNGDGTRLTYTAPKSVHQEHKIFISARPSDDSSFATFCTIRLIPDNSFVIADDGETRGLVGNVYRLSPSTQVLPDFDQMESVANVVLANLDVPQRDFASGFPGVEDLDEWFGIRFQGRLILDKACYCDFRLLSDDGANLYINGELIVDNDGVHAVRVRTGGVYLDKGIHNIRVDYFQGPRYHIALQLGWRHDSNAAYQIIEPEYFARP